MGRDEAEVAYLRANISALAWRSTPRSRPRSRPGPISRRRRSSRSRGARPRGLERRSQSSAATLPRDRPCRRATGECLAHPELRNAVAAALGKESGAALTGSPGYDPTPTQSGGWHTWRRLDVGADPAAVKKAFGKRKLFHALSGGMSPAELIRNGGVLASTERRALMGNPLRHRDERGLRHDDRRARSVFLRVGGGSNSGDVFEWADPTTLLQRCDWYAYPGDHFGALNPRATTSAPPRSPAIPPRGHLHGHNNEVMFRNGIDLLGSEAPSRIRCSSPKRREDTLAALAARGITQLRASPSRRP